MNKKGFTLVELLAVIGLIAAFALITVPTVDSLIKKQKQKLYEGHKKDITEALKLWGNMNIELLPEEEDESITVTLEELKLVGLANDDMTNPKTNKCYANNNTFTITKEKNGYVYVVTDLTDGNASDCEVSFINCFIFNESTKTIVGYNYENDFCPTNIIIPDKIDNVEVENIGPIAFVDLTLEEDQYILYNSYDDEKDIYYVDIPKNFETLGIPIEYIAILNINDYSNQEKICYYGQPNENGEYQYDSKSMDYEVTSSDNYYGCYINCENYEFSAVEGYGYITSVDFSQSAHLETIGQYAFSGNNIEELTVPSTVRTIENFAFADNGNLMALILNEGLETIGQYAFSGDNIEELTIPSTVRTIGDGAFSNNNIEELTVPSTVRTIGDRAFYSNDNLTTLILNEGLETIGQYAFSGDNIEELTIPSTVRTIGDGAFYSNDNLTTLILNEGLETISRVAFYSNDIRSLTIPSTVTTIGENAFISNYNLTTINVNRSADSITGAPWGTGSNTQINWIGTN